MVRQGFDIRYKFREKYLGVSRWHFQEVVFGQKQHGDCPIVGHGNLALETPRCHRGKTQISDVTRECG